MLMTITRVRDRLVCVLNFFSRTFKHNLSKFNPIQLLKYLRPFLEHDSSILIKELINILFITRIYPFSEGDVDVSGSIHGSQEKDFKAWYPEILDLVECIFKDNNTDITKTFSSVGKVIMWAYSSIVFLLLCFSIMLLSFKSR